VNEWEQCTETAREALELFEELDDRFGAAWSAHSLGLALTALKQPAEARPYFEKALRMFSDAGDLTGIGLALYDFAALAGTLEDYERALKLRAAAAVVEERSGQALVSNMESYFDWLPDFNAHGLSTVDEARVRAEGEAFSTEEAVAYALSEESAQPEVP
jgi:tetratricopeptide (TPR) repeat protein